MPARNGIPRFYKATVEIVNQLPYYQDIVVSTPFVEYFLSMLRRASHHPARIRSPLTAADTKKARDGDNTIAVPGFCSLYFRHDGPLRPQQRADFLHRNLPQFPPGRQGRRRARPLGPWPCRRPSPGRRDCARRSPEAHRPAASRLSIPLTSMALKGIWGTLSLVTAILWRVCSPSAWRSTG